MGASGVAEDTKSLGAVRVYHRAECNMAVAERGRRLVGEAVNHAHDDRTHGRRQHVLDLEHYLDVLSHKPGAFAGSKPLAQWREAGRWPACYDELWNRLLARHGKQNGNRAMVAVVLLGREFGHDKLCTAVTTAVSLGACDVAAVRYLLTEARLHKGRAYAVDVGELARYDRPMPTMAEYRPACLA